MHAYVGDHIVLQCYACSNAFIFCTSITFRKSMCYDLDPKSRLLGQGHNGHASLFFRAIFPHFIIHVVALLYLAQMFLEAKRCVMTLTQGHDNMSRSQWTCIVIFCHDHIFLLCFSYTYILYKNVTCSKTMCHDLDSRSRLKGQGHSRCALWLLDWAIFSYCISNTFIFGINDPCDNTVFHELDPRST